MLPEDGIATDHLAASVRDTSVRYGEPLGDGALRLVLATRLQGMGIGARAEHIVITVGATHALDIISRTRLKPGDSVMVEEPGWAVEFARLSALGMRILSVPRGPQGPDLAVMQRLCEAHAGTAAAPRLFVSVSVLHNPTGACLSPAHAHRVLQLAQRHGFWIAEDDSYCHLAPEHATRLATLDGLQRTIYTSAALPKFWRPTGAWASWQRRPSWSSRCWTPSCSGP